MYIEILTVPYEVINKTGVKESNLYMARVKTKENGKEEETIIAYHPISKNFFLMKDSDNNLEDLKNSADYTDKSDPIIIEEFLEINKKEVTVRTSSESWTFIVAS